MKQPDPITLARLSSLCSSTCTLIRIKCKPPADSAVSVPLCSYLNGHNGGSDPNGAVGNQGADALIVNITDTRNLLKSLGMSIPVGNSDAGSYFNNKVLEAVDYGVRLGSRPFARAR